VNDNDESVGSGVHPGLKQTGDDSRPLCGYCGEPVLPHESLALIEGDPLHYECGFRSVAGSVGHQMGQCPCYGVEDVSEIGMTRRQAAKLSLAYYLNHRKRTGANRPARNQSPRIA